VLTKEISISFFFSSQGTETIEGLALKLHFTGKDCFKAYAFEDEEFETVST